MQKETEENSVKPKRLSVPAHIFEKDVMLKAGWAVKESGQKDLFGKHNWRRRWFTLKRMEGDIIMSYYGTQSDTIPKGSFKMNREYLAREIETETIKKKPNCFALGPMIDCGLRTYFISCENEEEMLEWILVINTTLEGCKAEKIIKRKSTYRIRGRHKMKGSGLSAFAPSESGGASDDRNFKSYEWRLDQWHKLCGIALESSSWKNKDTKNGVSVSRQKFNRSDIAYFKIEGIVNAKPNVVYEYLYRSLTCGGKLDMLFRFEEVFEKVEVGKTKTYFARTEYEVPIPAVKNRDMCYYKMWLPPRSTNKKCCGMVIQSVPHADDKDHVRIDVGLSGLVISPLPSAEGHSSVVIVIGIDLEDALQNMLRGAFKSGLLRGALRRMFNEIIKKVEKYNRLLYDIKEIPEPDVAA